MELDLVFILIKNYRVIALGSSAFIREVNKFIVLKYSLSPGGDVSRLEIKKELLKIIGLYPQIVGLKSLLDIRLYLERAGVLYCNIQPINLLLNKKLYLKLLDFQGKLLLKDGEVLLDDDLFEVDIKTDLFALGYTMYFIIIGHAVFPDIINGEDGWYDKVVDRFAMQQFPQDSHACSAITLKCWLRQYSSAQDVVQEIETIEKTFRD
ncbi:hypothetical protein K469DRAFT_732991 [Zopfia rhizophila CBS 207.26]|uniref:Protein kinase domain-containing protein n=1 Tax=Zopfia rhizophila CBS 207.26 TaxID=1314779 RepID=A0A6A6DI79_9PEZI|nr:hypothetical protein K469DRAFT_732991 [Zopfia rhizophila CBS 207.26]